MVYVSAEITVVGVDVVEHKNISWNEDWQSLLLHKMWRCKALNIMWADSLLHSDTFAEVIKHQQTLNDWWLISDIDHWC